MFYCYLINYCFNKETVSKNLNSSNREILIAAKCRWIASKKLKEWENVLEANFFFVKKYCNNSF